MTWASKRDALNDNKEVKEGYKEIITKNKRIMYITTSKKHYVGYELKIIYGSIILNFE
jgi:hypothetical protein